MRKAHVYFFSSAIVLFGLLYSLDVFYSSWTKKIIFDKTSWILNMENRKFDLAFLGSSRVFNMIDTDTAEKKTGAKVLNMGSGGAALMENYLTLKTFLDHGNKISTLCLQLDESSLIDMRKAFSYPFREYLFFGNMQDEELAEAICKHNGRLRYYCWTYLPFVKYAEFSNIFSLKYFFRPLSADPESFTADQLERSRGSALLHNIVLSDSLRKKCERLNTSKFIIDSTSVFYLGKIVALAAKKDIRLILYRAPEYHGYYTRTGWGASAEKYVSEFARRNSTMYLSFQKMPVSEDPEKFKDYTHLNAEGTGIFTACLADSLNLILKNNESLQ